MVPAQYQAWFDAFVLALIVLQSAQPLGDIPDCLNPASPKYFCERWFHVAMMSRSYIYLHYTLMDFFLFEAQK
jgi:hypothetical protein